MTTEKKPKIEAIYPLSSMQQGLLFHHLMEGEDQGFLHVQCVLEGVLDLEKLKTAWQSVTLRHEVMRTSVHWKKIERPIRVVRPEKNIEWTLLNWSQKTPIEQEDLLKNYKEESKQQGVNFEKTPLSNITLIQKSSTSYFLIWSCHHLLLDGWSSTIILKDVFKYYQGLCSDTTPNLETIPSYKSYSNWLQRHTTDEAASFWSKTFDGFIKPSLFEQKQSVGNTTQLQYTKAFSEETTADLKQLAKYYRVTLNTLFQGIWSLLLKHYFKNNDITFGTTVSGRSIPFPNIELMAGMFANVLPVRSVLNPSETFESHLTPLQSQQQEARNYEYCTSDQIANWVGLSPDIPLFNSLFVFENFPWEDIDCGDLKVKGFESGLTTTYPITAIFKIEDCIEYTLQINPNLIAITTVQWFLESISKLAEALLENKGSTVSELLETLPILENEEDSFSKKEKKSNTSTEENYAAPRNQVELQLVEIWERIFGINCISIKDSFFDLGGKSLLAVKMFSFIEEEIEVKLPPTTLLEYPTIELLADVIKADNHETVQWKYLIPIKAKGTKNPLFCIHAGGGHVFFYKDLANAIDQDRPVYALQPVGIFGEDEMHHSIETMAKDYADEIIIAQPKGIINVVVYCFSTCVGVEIASYLKTKGRQVNVIVADTIAEHRLLLDKERLSIRVFAFLKRLAQNPFKALNAMIGFRIMFYLKPIKINLFGSEAEKNTEKIRVHLVKLFNKYQWKTKIDTVVLIVSKKVDDRYNGEIVKSWKSLTDNDIPVTEFVGDHASIFNLPDVKNTAEAVNNSILD